MKIRKLNKNALLNYFSDFAHPYFLSDPHALRNHNYKPSRKSKIYFVRHLLENDHLREIYSKLEKLYLTSLLDYEDYKSHHSCPHSHPLQEQKWFIEYLSTQKLYFSAQDLWWIIFYHEERHHYASLLQKEIDLDAFDLFVQNYFIQSLSKQRLSDIFFVTLDCPKEDRLLRLKKLFICLCTQQAKLLFKVLYEQQMPYMTYLSQCRDALQVMRNAQIKEVISFIPSELEIFALEKLYPCEILEVIDQEIDDKKKRLLIETVLHHGKQWWSFFPQDDINKTYSLLLTKKS